jgi:hypothetical protein
MAAGPAGTFLLIPWVALDLGQVSADPRSRRHGTLHPHQRALPIPELQAEAIYAYSFILTSLEVTTPGKAAAAQRWYRRTCARGRRTGDSGCGGGQRAARAHGVLRRTRQRTGSQGLPRLGDPAMA